MIAVFQQAFRRRFTVTTGWWCGFACLVSALMLATVFADLVTPGDDTDGIGPTGHVTQKNGFTLKWVALRTTSSPKLNLVFIHGSPGGWGAWSSQFRSPHPDANLFAYDRPGFEESKPARSRPHLEDQVEGLMTWLPEATTNRVIVVGHSYGSPIALLAALKHPDKVDGVLLIGGDVDPSLERPWWIQYPFHWKLTSWLLPREWRQCNREMLTVRADLKRMQALLRQLTVPVVMLHGDKDPLVPVKNVDWLETQLTRAGKSNLFAKVVLPGVNHFIPWEHPDEVEKAIDLLEKMTQHGESSPSTSGSPLP